MPIYEYLCQDCHKRYEKIQKVGDPPCKKCPNCGGSLKKLISPPALQFKGHGFYITDYVKKESSSEEKSGGMAKAKEKDKSASEKAEPLPSDKPCSD
jgi:putative FmdB family regulatory protein